MNPVSASSALMTVPNRDRVTAAVALQPVDMNPHRPRQETGAGAGPGRTSHTGGARAGAAGTGRTLGSLAAGPGFAVAVLVEAGLTGSDPWQAGRRLKAYAGGGASAGLGGSAGAGAVRFVA